MKTIFFTLALAAVTSTALAGELTRTTPAKKAPEPVKLTAKVSAGVSPTRWDHVFLNSVSLNYVAPSR